ncbi:hypothetical protein [Phenylobacterium sp. Root700]|uniref:hypothetical protein n=1 Tax=Phenylobacterium sp. Root700 TaxID=1736591 RepID=UPI000ACDB656|nr:hypothetical protein [Phenylobacterium sp. Root700]
MKLNSFGIFAMNQVDQVARTLGDLSAETLVLFIGLGALGVAAFAIYAVLTIARRGKD